MNMFRRILSALNEKDELRMQMLGINAFIGIDALKNSEVGISFIERCIEVK